MWRISPIKHTHFVYASMSWFSYQSLIVCVCVCAMWWETTAVFKLWCHNAKLWWQLSTFTSSGFPILLPTGKDATVLLTMYIIQGIAQLVQCYIIHEIAQLVQCYMIHGIAQLVQCYMIHGIAQLVQCYMIHGIAQLVQCYMIQGIAQLVQC